jgi:hypothetical protein
MASFNIPWKCLDNTIEPIIDTIEPPKPQKTFAQALGNLCDIPISQFPQPVVRGDRLAIEIPEVAYEAGLDACKHNLHGRILWSKGSTPLSVVALKAKLSAIWKDLSRWGVISLGKGFFEFTFSSLEDVKRVRSTPSWNLNPGLLKLFAWSRDFNPKLQHNTSVQVWVKIFGLSQEYWHKNILFTIAGSIGTPICMDSASAKPMFERTFGQFVRILIDIDLLQPLRHKLLVERKGFAFFVDGCRVIGHNVENCKRWNKDEEYRNDKVNNVKKKAPLDPKQIFVQTKDGRKTQDKEPVIVETEIINVEDSSNKTPQAILNSSSKNTSGSTSKNNHRSPTDKEYEQNFVLQPVSPRTLLRNQDMQLENDLNEDFDDDVSSNDSIVNDTQSEVAVRQDVSLKQPILVSTTPIQQVSQIGNVTGKAVVSSTVSTPDRVAKDMAFLKESWANIADAEEGNQMNLADTRQHDDLQDEGFQMQLSKSQKKAQKKLKHSSRDSYTTRSKGVSQKPFR